MWHKCPTNQKLEQEHDLSHHVFVCKDTCVNVRFRNAAQSSIPFSDDGCVLDALQDGSH